MSRWLMLMSVNPKTNSDDVTAEPNPLERESMEQNWLIYHSRRSFGGQIICSFPIVGYWRIPWFSSSRDGSIQSQSAEKWQSSRASTNKVEESSALRKTGFKQLNSISKASHRISLFFASLEPPAEEIVVFFRSPTPMGFAGWEMFLVAFNLSSFLSRLWDKQKTFKSCFPCLCRMMRKRNGLCGLRTVKRWRRKVTAASNESVSGATNCLDN